MPHISKTIVFPQDLAEIQPALLGGKGANLVRLVKCGYPVPPFFVISTEAYRQFLDHPPTRNTVQEIRRVWPDQGAVGCRAIAQTLREQMDRAETSGELKEAIRLAVDRCFGGEPAEAALAVRSSANVEDAHQFSFAGVFETYFVDCSNLVDSVKKCWASLWQESALFYFEKVGLPPWEVQMAVIVQAVVCAESSGVLFTRLRVPEFGEVLQIESHPGAAASRSPAGGPPITYLLSRSDGSVLEKTLGPGNKRGGSSAINREMQEEASARRGDRGSVLDDRQLESLFELGVKLEALFASPQDVEWAYEGRRCYVLQSRPITATGFKTRGEIKRIWTPFFFLERFPHPVSPLGWSLLEGPVIHRAFREPLRLLGQHRLAKQRISRLFYGRPYTDTAVFRWLYGFIPPLFLSEDKRDLITLGGRQPPSWFRRLYLYVPFFVRTVAYDANWFFIFHLKRWYDFTHWYRRQIRNLRAVNLKALNKRQLLEALLLTQQLTDRFLIPHRWSITYADIFYQLLNVLCKNWLPKRIRAVRLLSGLEGNQTVEMNLGLWRLSRIVANSAELKSALLEKKVRTVEEIRSFCGDRNFVRAFEAFLRRYGHRSNSLDVYHATWSEDASYVLEVIRKYLGVNEASSPVRAEMERRERQRRLERQALSRLSRGALDRLLPVRTWLFSLTLRFAKEFVRLRENQRFYWQMSIAEMRRVALELGRHLCSEKRIERAEDVFFIPLEELSAHVRQGKDFDWPRLVRARKRSFARHQKEIPPTLVKEYADGSLDFDFGGKGVEVLRGMPISPGKARGRARVIADLNRFETLDRGDILVTQSLDPGWTPIFGLISGVVMEVGGMLSHGSILAREFGIPAVSNIKGLHQKIKDGDEIVVDGTRGQVVRL